VASARDLAHGVHYLTTEELTRDYTVHASIHPSSRRQGHLRVHPQPAPLLQFRGGHPMIIIVNPRERSNRHIKCDYSIIEAQRARQLIEIVWSKFHM
jgi:hypothetical protein